MNADVYAPDAFEHRVQFAKQALLDGDTGTREFDTCFEMLDGDLVMVRLLQEAEKSEQLAASLARYDIASLRCTLYPVLKHAAATEIARLARDLRERFEGDTSAMWPMLACDA